MPRVTLLCVWALLDAKRPLRSALAMVAALCICFPSSSCAAISSLDVAAGLAARHGERRAVPPGSASARPGLPRSRNPHMNIFALTFILMLALVLLELAVLKFARGQAVP